MATTLEQYTQRGINALLNTTLKDDGIFGEKTLSKIPVVVKVIKDIYIRKGYKWSDGYNLGAFRMDDVLTNQFSDWAFIVIANKDIRLFPLSTKPGLVYMQQKDTKGGIILEGQYIDMYSLQEAYWSGMKFLQQTKPYNFYRDCDLDNVVDRGKVHNDASGFGGFNFHSYYNAATKWFWNLPIVSDVRAGILSKGCQVTMADIWKLVIPYLELMVKTSATKRITYTLLHKNDLIL